MSRYADAAWVPAGTPGGAITPRVLILHTEATVGQAQPHSGLEWHFMVMNDGRVKQLVDTNLRADANNKANPFAISVETEDDGSPDADPWTPQQVKAIVKLCRWAHEEHGIPLRRCDGPYGSGIGYHTMWGAPSEWTPVAKTCPGAARKHQFETEVLPLLAGPSEEDDDMFTDEDRTLLLREYERASKRDADIDERLDKILLLLGDTTEGTVGRRTKEITLAVRKLLTR